MSDGVGNAEVGAEEVMDMEDLLDSEMLEINRVAGLLSTHIGTSMEGSALQREVRERYAEIGFVVRCDLWKEDDDPRAWADRPWIPAITFLGRTEKQGEFDHDRMGHEVRSNILGKNVQGDVQQKIVGQTGFSGT